MAIISVRPRVVPPSKRCRNCHKEQSRDEFYADSRNSDGLSAWCKPCLHIYQKEHRTKQSEQIKQKRRRKAYGITSEEFDTLLSRQHGLCAICGGPPTVKRGWCVDHDHTSGKVRGLLCTNCNIGLGNFKENPAALQSAVYYLTLHDENVTV